jgi:serine/threonine-protein kinase
MLCPTICKVSDLSNPRQELRRGEQLVSRIKQLREEMPAVERMVDVTARSFPSWESHTRKQAVVEAEDNLASAERELGLAEGRAIAVLTSLQGVPEVEDEARAALADLYWHGFLSADARQDRTAAATCRALAEHYNAGELDRALSGAGTLSLRSEPAGAAVDVIQQREDGFLLVDGDVIEFGTTPITEASIEMGSYVAVLRLPGFRDVRYPIDITRNGSWDATVRMYREDEIGADFVYIPAGPFVQGGDPKTKGWGHPRSEPFVASFFIARHPITQGEYLEFLNDLASSAGLDEAQARAPRRYPQHGSYLVPQDGRLTFPQSVDEPDGWNPRLPAFAISWHDAAAYADWRSKRDGLAYRLPTEVEWEKAARGVDARWHPWGNRFDASLCNMRDSRPDGPGPVPVDDFPTDVSVYGVRGMGGNVRDWTSTAIVEEAGVAAIAELGYQRYRDAHDTRVVRGGAWSPLIPRVTDRYWLPPDTVLAFIGFRLALSPAEFD